MIHHNSLRVFYVDVNDFRREFEVMIYYLKSDKNHKSIKKLSSNKKFSSDDERIFFSFKRKNVKFIIFLNRMLTTAKKKYWFIELKMINFVWLIKRIRHLIKIFKHVIIIYTNHVVNSFIVRQIKFINNSVNKLNMKLIRIFVYLSQFRLNIRYKLNKNL